MAGITIPLGCKFKFEPEDHEILVYLSRKCKGELLPCEGFIKEVDLYSITDPGVLFERTRENGVYVFTKLKKVAKNGKRVDRTVSGNRTWKGVDAGKPIYDAQGFLVGEKKNFVLVNKMKMKLGYNMTEFCLDNEALRNSRFNDYVVCQIKKKAKKARSLRDGNPPKEKEDICPTFVSTPAMEGDTMAYSEEGYQEEQLCYQVTESHSEEGYHHDEGSCVVLSRSQEEQAQPCCEVSESQGMSDLMPRLSGDFESDMGLKSSGYFDPNLYQQINLWMMDDDGLGEHYETSQELLDLDKIIELASSSSVPSAIEEYIMCRTSVSTPAIQGDVTAYSEEEYQYDEVDSWLIDNIKEAGSFQSWT